MSNSEKSDPGLTLVTNAPGTAPGLVAGSDDRLTTAPLTITSGVPGAPGWDSLDKISGSRGHSAVQGENPRSGGAEGAPATSLDLYRESVLEVCPSKPRFLVSLSSGQMVHVGCQRHACLVCGPKNTRRLSQAVSYRLSVPGRARFCTLTNAPEDWQSRRQKVRNLRRYLRSRGYSWEMFWSCERGTQTGMLHVHGIQHGDYVPQAVLQEVWGQIVDIRAVRSSKVSGYVLKDAARVAGYTLKGDSNAERLALNGGRPAHWSRGFFGKRLDEVYAEMQTGDAGPWEVSTLAAAVAARRRGGVNVHG